MTCAADGFCHEPGDQDTCTAGTPADGLGGGSGDARPSSPDAGGPAVDGAPSSTDGESTPPPDASPVQSLHCPSGWTSAVYSDEFSAQVPGWADLYVGAGMTVEVDE